MEPSVPTSFLWRVDRDASRGRMLRATRAIKTGENLLREKAFGNVVLKMAKSELCAVCMRPADPDVCCDDCGQVFFCSEQCQDVLQQVHEKECEALEEVDLIAKKSSVDADLLRLLIRILAARPVAKQLNAELAVSATGEVLSCYADVQRLVHVMDTQAEKWAAQVRDGARRVLDYLPDECQLPVDEILVIAAQVNENSYALDALDENHLIATVGLFPICGLINHSCQPNCTWSNAGNGVMEVRALRDLDEGEEITLSYVDIDQDRTERRRALEETKHFYCECERCSTPLEASVDRFLQGLRCPRCPKKSDDSTDLVLLTPTQDDSVLACALCQASFTQASVATAVASARSLVDSAKNSLAKFDYAKVIDLLTPLTLGLEERTERLPFHPSHALCIASSRVLADAHRKLGDVLPAYELRRSVVQGLTRVSARNHLPLAIAHLDYADAIRRLVVHPATATGSLALPLDRQTLVQDMNASYDMFHDMAAICLGAPHPLRHQARPVVNL